MKALRIKVWPSNREQTWRTIEIASKQTLSHLHRFLVNEFGLGGDHLYCFYLSGSPYDAKTAYGGPRSETDLKAQKTKLSSMKLKAGKRFVYVFDFASTTTLELEVQQILDLPDKVRLPRISKRGGKSKVSLSPKAKGGENEDQDLGQIEGILPEITKAARWLSEGKRPSKGALKSQFENASRCAEVLAGNWEKVKSMEKRTGEDISGWLVALPEALTSEGLVEEALKVIDTFTELEPESFLSDRPGILLAADRRKEALNQVEENKNRFPEDAWIWAKGADVLWRAGEVSKAEECYKKGLELARSKRYLRDTILERLLSLLEEAGKSGEAQKISQQEEKRRERARGP